MRRNYKYRMTVAA